MRRPDSFGASDNLPMVVFAGRSNVGKSSIIRVLTGRKVRVGKRPGSTRGIIQINMGTMIIVDVPGFGYMARQSKVMIERTKTEIIQSIETWRERIVLSVLVIDISLFRELVERWENRGEIPIDIEYYLFLNEVSPQVLVVANKIDKLKKRERNNAITYLTQRLIAAAPEQPLSLAVTSVTKREGIKELKRKLESILKGMGIEQPYW